MVVEKDMNVYERCLRAEPAFLAAWETLVNIDSPTGYDEGLAQVRGWIVDRMNELGARINYYPAASGNGEGHISGQWYGTGKSSILLLAHMDTVLPVGSAAERPFRIDADGKAYGPGVSDNKSSIVQCLQAVKILRELKFSDFGRITFFSNCDEENDSPTSKAVIAALGKEHDCILCVEGGRPGDGLVTGRSGNGVLDITVRGVTSHASAPYEGINAADEAARFILDVNKLADIGKGTLITTRVIEAGTDNRMKSVVPDQAAALVRIGAASREELERVLSAVEKRVRRPYTKGSVIESDFRLDFPIFPQTKKTAEMACIAQTIYAGLGKNLVLATASAGADSCWAATENEAVLDGVGIVSGGKNHTAEEWADANSVVPRLYLMTKLLMELGSWET
ncbi:MAG: M20/M25/M40 family metallo-hydrolase [Negativicutes bacterium]